jgi:hypothetical protein
MVLRTDNAEPQSRLDNADVRWEYREDRGELLRPSRRGNVLFVEGVAAKEGILEYRRADGSMRREFVPASTLQRAGIRLARSPVTLLHPNPDQYPNGVTPENYADLGVGDVDGEVVVGDGGFTKVRLAIRRKDAIESVESGETRELSCGYKVRLDETPGENAYGRYDAVQVERTDNNHLALVPFARAGRSAAVRADGAIATTVIRADGAQPAGTPAPRKSMNPLFASLLAGYGIFTPYQTDEAALAALADAQQRRADDATKADRKRAEELAAEKARADAAERARDAEKARADAAERARDAEKVRADTATTEIDRFRADAAARVDAEERKTLEPLCRSLRVDAAAHPETPKLKRALVQAHRKGEIPTTWTQARVDAEVDHLREDRAEGREAGSRVLGSPVTPRVVVARMDGAPPARSRMHRAALTRFDGHRRDEGGEA